jgi:GH43 family beta-xylosidase
VGVPARSFLFTLLAAVASLAQTASPTFTNPLLPSGPDPWVTSRDGWYYYMNTTATNLTVRKTRDITDLEHAQTKAVWSPPPSGPYSKEIWAPELHFLDGKWYIYFAADAGDNRGHRIYAIENNSADPLSGDWTFKGKVSDPSDHWAIDPTVFENGAHRYIIWSGWPGAENGSQDLYIARLKNPWTIDGPRVRISRPRYQWEKIGDLPGDAHVNVNEGPEILKHGERIFLIYSASGCWTDSYELGMLETRASADLLNPGSWKKSAKPVFTGSPAAHAYSPGHNAFFVSPDGRQNWILYHANPEPHEGCGNQRSPRAQLFKWNPDGTPDFGQPVPLGAPIPKPAGTPVQ